MNQKLNDIYSFLNENRAYNLPVQIGAYKMALMPYNTTYDKVYALLYSILNSQSQLKMDKSAVFFQTIVNPDNSLNSFTGFLKTLGASNDTHITYKSMFQLLTKQPSWGDKTAALFVKAIYHTHIGYAKELHFWDDAPETLTANDELFLPVDAVIKHIIQEIGSPCANSFSGINTYLKNNMPNSNFEVWDDLWFWGFITQKVNKDKRTMEFNEAKYWNMLDAPKDKETIATTQQLAKQFIDLLKN